MTAQFEVGQFELASGTITGRNHNQRGINNQDAFYSLADAQTAIAVVGDGCGSCSHSEVGAKLGVRFVVEAIANQIAEPINPEFWQRLQANILGKLHNLALTLGGDTQEKLGEIVKDYLLFTIVGAVITPTETAIFAIGDGAIAINGKVLVIEEFPNNAPPYLAYGLLGAPVNLQIYGLLPTAEVNSLLIATDGIQDLIESQAKMLPGKSEIVGNIDQFWQEDRYFQNPDAIRRKLALINREVVKPNWQEQCLDRSGGLLSDDTTLITIRKRSLRC